MYSVKVDVKDFSRAIESSMEARVAAAVVKATQAVYLEAVQIILAKRTRTGNMAGETFPSIESKFEGRVTSPSDYAGYQHDGFWHVGAGRFVPGEPWFNQALAKVEPSFVSDIRSAVGG